MVNVTWDDTQDYCRWLSARTKKMYRLPTEAEWEKGARGEDGRVYPWGNEFDKEKANTFESGMGDTTAVDRYENGKSTHGIYDMIGNVWEWCNDWFGENEYASREGKMIKDPQGPQKGTARVVRGGSWHNVRHLARCAARYGDLPDPFRYSIGFRVVLSPDAGP